MLPCFQDYALSRYQLFSSLVALLPVDCVGNGLAIVKFFIVALKAHCNVGRLGISCNMWGQLNFRMLPERMVFRQRLLVKHVQDGHMEPVIVQSSDQILVRDDVASANIDQGGLFA